MYITYKKKNLHQNVYTYYIYLMVDGSADDDDNKNNNNDGKIHFVVLRLPI